MKPNFFTLLILLFLMPAITQAQNVFYSDSSDTYVCDTTYYLNVAPNSADFSGWNYGHFVINASNIINSNLSLDVNWGDGTTTTHTGTAVTSGTAIAWNTPLSHLYSTGGNYTLVLILTDLTNNNTYTSTLDIIMGACNQYIYTSGIVDCDNDGNNDSTIVAQIPVAITNGNQFYYGSTTPNGTVFYQVIPGDYQVVVDPNWLTNNGYLVSSITPDSITAGFFTNTGTVQITLICDSTLFTSNCLNGTVFCDGNNNGIMDSTDTPLANAPISLFLMSGGGSGNTYTATTDVNGLYSINYTGFNGIGHVTVDQSWLNSNGYVMTNTSLDTVSDLDCANNPVQNIAVICDTNVLGIGCINGYVFCDDNGNGILDTAETVFSNAPVTLNGLGGQITVYTDSTGYYSYTGWQLSGGNIFVSIDQTWQSNNNAFVPSNGIFLNNLNCSNNNQANLGLNCNTALPCADLWTTVTPWIGYYQNTTNSIILKYGNYGSSAPGSYTVTLDYPSGVTPVLSSINNPNYTISGNTITWTLTSNNSYMYHSDIIYFTTPAGIPDSTWHLFSSTISTSSDCDSSNNYSTLGMLVGVSYDPNDKSVNKPYVVDPAVQDQYTYVIRFQNTGTAPAQDVFILDTLSTNLDWTTFELIKASHQMQLVELGNGVIKFDFPQIWLPDSTSNEPASHGHVIYRIKELASLTEGDAIENTAYIYFDQNAPIVTNTTVNLNTDISDLGITANGSLEFVVFPNPAVNQVNVQSESMIKTIRIIDLSGRLVYESTANNNLESINIQNLSSGTYHIEVISEEGTGRKLFIKE